jgi:ubiquinone/menaquinone biosynthesis methyltransferase
VAVRAMFDRIAPTYDTLNRLMSAGIDKRWRIRAVRELRDAPPGALLDLCAGTMDFTVLLADAFPERRLVAADFSKSMLDAGRTKAPRAETVVANAMEMPFKDAEFAATVCGFGIRNVSDPRRALADVKRILAPGGIFVTLEFFRPTRTATRAFHAAYNRFVLPTVGGLVSGDRGAYSYLAKSMEGFMTRSEYEVALRDAGFVHVRAFDVTLGIASIVCAEVPR